MEEMGVRVVDVILCRIRDFLVTHGRGDVIQVRCQHALRHGRGAAGVDDANGVRHANVGVRQCLVALNQSRPTAPRTNGTHAGSPWTKTSGVISRLGKASLNTGANSSSTTNSFGTRVVQAVGQIILGQRHIERSVDQRRS